MISFFSICTQHQFSPDNNPLTCCFHDLSCKLTFFLLYIFFHLAPFLNEEDDMGGVFSHAKSNQRGYSRGRSSGNSNIVTRGISSPSSSTSYPYPHHPRIMSKEPSSSLSNTARATGSDTSSQAKGTSQAKGGSKLEKKQSIKQKYSFIPDNFSSLEQVRANHPL